METSLVYSTRSALMTIKEKNNTNCCSFNTYTCLNKNGWHLASRSEALKSEKKSEGKEEEIRASIICNYCLVCGCNSFFTISAVCKLMTIISSWKGGGGDYKSAFCHNNTENLIHK